MEHAMLSCPRTLDDARRELARLAPRVAHATEAAGSRALTAAVVCYGHPAAVALALELIAEGGDARRLLVALPEVPAAAGCAAPRAYLTHLPERRRCARAWLHLAPATATGGFVSGAGDGGGFARRAGVGVAVARFGNAEIDGGDRGAVGGGAPPPRRRRRPPARVLLLAAPVPPADTGWAWGRRVARLVHLTNALVSSNAYISTLGGGFFLTRQLGPALVLAQLQMAVARALGDARLWARCLVHVTYALVQAGRFRTASRLARRLAAAAADPELDDPTLGRMCAAARRYCVRTHRLWADGTLVASAPTSREQQARDEYYRQRLAELGGGDGGGGGGGSAAAAADVPPGLVDDFLRRLSGGGSEGAPRTESAPFQAAGVQTAHLRLARLRALPPSLAAT
jgi:hypothetical protein